MKKGQQKRVSNETLSLFAVCRLKLVVKFFFVVVFVVVDNRFVFVNNFFSNFVRADDESISICS